MVVFSNPLSEMSHGFSHLIFITIIWSFQLKRKLLRLFLFNWPKSHQVIRLSHESWIKDSDETWPYALCWCQKGAHLPQAIANEMWPVVSNRLLTWLKLYQQVVWYLIEKFSCGSPKLVHTVSSMHYCLSKNLHLLHGPLRSSSTRRHGKRKMYSSQTVVQRSRTVAFGSQNAMKPALLAFITKWVYLGITKKTSKIPHYSFRPGLFAWLCGYF